MLACKANKKKRKKERKKDRKKEALEQKQLIGFGDILDQDPSPGICFFPEILTLQSML